MTKDELTYIENVERFYNYLKEEKEIRDSFLNCLESVEGSSEDLELNYFESGTNFARDLGFNFTTQDLRDFLANKRAQLSEEELESIVGGAGFFDFSPRSLATFAFMALPLVATFSSYSSQSASAIIQTQINERSNGKLIEQTSKVKIIHDLLLDNSSNIKTAVKERGGGEVILDFSKKNSPEGGASKIDLDTVKQGWNRIVAQCNFQSNYFESSYKDIEQQDDKITRLNLEESQHLLVTIILPALFTTKQGGIGSARSKKGEEVTLLLNKYSLYMVGVFIDEDKLYLGTDLRYNDEVSATLNLGGLEAGIKEIKSGVTKGFGFKSALGSIGRTLTMIASEAAREEITREVLVIPLMQVGSVETARYTQICGEVMKNWKSNIEKRRSTKISNQFQALLAELKKDGASLLKIKRINQINQILGKHPADKQALINLLQDVASADQQMQVLNIFYPDLQFQLEPNQPLRLNETMPR